MVREEEKAGQGAAREKVHPAASNSTGGEGDGTHGRGTYACASYCVQAGKRSARTRTRSR